MEFTTAFNSILMLILIMAIGFFFRKKNIVGNEASGTLSTILVNIMLPALGYSVFAQNFSRQTISSYGADIMWSIAIVIISFIMSVSLAKLIGKRGQLYDVIV